MRLVIHQFDVVHCEVVDALHFGIQPELWKRQRFSAELQPDLVEVVVVDVCVAQYVDEFVRFEPRDLRYHVEEKRVRGNVEWYPKEHIAASLEHQERELSCCGEKLEDHGAWRK